jgi:hypothetical protein
VQAGRRGGGNPWRADRETKRALPVGSHRAQVGPKGPEPEGRVRTADAKSGPFRDELFLDRGPELATRRYTAARTAEREQDVSVPGDVVS